MRRAYDEKYRFLSTPSARRATAWSFATRSPTIISIHALREEGDLSPCAALLLRLEFLSTPSARRATFVPSRLLWEHFEFLSTPSARRATGFGAQTPSGGYDFYPRPPRGGRQDSETNGFRIIKFLSTPSARRATGLGDKWFQDHQISIHALREEGDRTRRQMVSGSSNFYPRPPRGGRPLARLVRADGTLFLSTPSARRATRMHHG